MEEMKNGRLHECLSCKATATFVPGGPTGGGSGPRCSVCGGPLVPVRVTRACSIENLHDICAVPWCGCSCHKGRQAR